MKILFITLSNIGDSILTLTVLDILRQKYPGASITCLVPPRPKEIFCVNPKIDKVIIFDKQTKLREKIKLFFSLAQERFDLVVDLRNSFFGAFLPAKKRSSPLRIIPSKIKHMRERHLFWAQLLDYPTKDTLFSSLVISPQDRGAVEQILCAHKIDQSEKLIIVAPGARSPIKRWDKKNYCQLCNQLLKEGADIILAGDESDKPVGDYLQQNINGKILNLCGQTSLAQLAALLNRAQVLITNDSAIMHLASYLDRPVVALFGPTDEAKYGPWSKNSLVIKKEVFCRPCNKAQCRFKNAICLTQVKVSAVLQAINSLLENRAAKDNPTSLYRRILIVRTDRMGDLLLSTPVVCALRKEYPQAFISMMVSPNTKDIVEGNPYLDEVLVYDKDFRHKNWGATYKFAQILRKKKFDLAVILHPTNRVHLLTFLAGIPVRLGYNRKLGFLLKIKKEHHKQEGLMHEAEYNLELLKLLGVSGLSRDLFMPLRPESEKWADNLWSRENIKLTDRILALNPGASCPSKIWPAERFSQVAQSLAQSHNLKVILLAGSKDLALANKIAAEGRNKYQIINLAGKTTLSQMASVLKRCTMLISNDSGPVHMASSLGVPVISIFGRNQPGLSPQRWGPLGKKDKYLHKNIGCVQCLAHNCQKDFACLKAISVSDVLQAAEEILSSI